MNGYDYRDNLDGISYNIKESKNDLWKMNGSTNKVLSEISEQLKEIDKSLRISNLCKQTDTALALEKYARKAILDIMGDTLKYPPGLTPKILKLKMYSDMKGTISILLSQQWNAIYENTYDEHLIYIQESLKALQSIYDKL